MKKHIRQRIDTTRLYRFEEESILLEPFRRQLTLKTLRKFADDYHNFQIIPTVKASRPTIIFGKGIKSGERYRSYFDPNENLIVLSKKERDKITLLHELIHSDGFDYHDRAFVTRELQWLHFFGKIATMNTLEQEARKYGLHPY